MGYGGLGHPLPQNDTNVHDLLVRVVKSCMTGFMRKSHDTDSHRLPIPFQDFALYSTVLYGGLKNDVIK